MANEPPKICGQAANPSPIPKGVVDLKRWDGSKTWFSPFLSSSKYVPTTLHLPKRDPPPTVRTVSKVAEQSKVCWKIR